MQAGMPGHAALQPDNLLVGDEPRGQVRLRCHVRQNLPGASAQRQRCLRQDMSPKEKGNFLISFNFFQPQ